MAACLVLCGTELHSTLIRMRLSRGGLREAERVGTTRSVTKVGATSYCYGRGALLSVFVDADKKLHAMYVVSLL